MSRSIPARSVYLPTARRARGSRSLCLLYIYVCIYTCITYPHRDTRRQWSREIWNCSFTHTHAAKFFALPASQKSKPTFRELRFFHAICVCVLLYVCFVYVVLLLRICFIYPVLLCVCFTYRVRLGRGPSRHAQLRQNTSWTALSRHTPSTLLTPKQVTPVEV